MIGSVLEADLISESGEYILDLFSFNDFAESSVEEVLSDIDDFVLSLLRIAVSECGNSAFRIYLPEEPERHIEADIDPLCIDTLLISHAGVCLLVEFSFRSSDSRCCKVSYLEEHRSCSVEYRVLFASLDACKAHRLLLIADHESVIVEFKLLVIEQHELFTRLCVSDDDLITLDMGGVEGVHRLADAKKNKICDINNSVDRSHARIGDKVLHPGRRFLYAYVLDLCSCVSRTAIRILYFYVIRRQPCRELSADFIERNLVDGSQFPGNSVMAP